MTRTDSAILAPPIGLVAFLALQLACAAATGDGCTVPYVAEVIEQLCEAWTVYTEESK